MIAATEAKVRHSKAPSRAMVIIPRKDDDVESVASSKAVSVASSRRSDRMRAKIGLQREHELAELRVEKQQSTKRLLKAVTPQLVKSLKLLRLSILKKPKLTPLRVHSQGGESVAI